MARLKVLIAGQRRGRARRIRRCLQRVGAEVAIGAFTSVRMEEADVVLPLSGFDTCYLNTVYPEFAGVKFLVPDAATFALCEDKQALFARLVEEGFCDYLPLPRSGEEVVRKPRIGSGGAMVRAEPWPAPEEQARHAPSWIYQRRLRTDAEYAGHFLVSARGEIVLAKAIRYAHGPQIMRRGLRDGAGVPVDIPPAHREVFAAMLRALGYRGFCCFDYFVEEGRPQVLELNARPGGSLVRMPAAIGPAYCRALRPDLTADWPPIAWPPAVSQGNLLRDLATRLRPPRPAA